MPQAGIGDRATGETAVYRLYDEAERLLYVGMSRNPMQRWSWHAEYHPWWPDVATYEVHWYGSRKEAAAVELEAIKDGQALHNRYRTPHQGALIKAGMRCNLDPRSRSMGGPGWG
jgi:hypothetical protein